jgi:CBS domain-containing protein
MLVSEVMRREIRLSSAEQSISACARMMAEFDTGVLPVREGDHLVGILTVRDIAVRAVAMDKVLETLAREVTSRQGALLLRSSGHGSRRRKHARDARAP